MKHSLFIGVLFATNTGRGYFVQYYADFSDHARVIGGYMFTAFVGDIIKLLFEKVKGRMLFWQLDDKDIKA